MKRMILIVEDYDDTRLFMNFLLKEFGYRVTEAINGAEAIESFKEDMPDLILMDISMPVMDGLTATKAIRKLKRGAKIPILAITAHGSRLYEQSIKAGCNGLIEKPVDLDSLKSTIELYFRA